jgi:type IV pilus assembly protein PilQ
MKNTRFRMLLIAAGLAVSLATAGAQAQRPSQQTAAAQGSGLAGPSAPQQPRKFTGAPIDVDYQGSNLRQVLRQLCDLGGVNVYLDPSVPINAAVDLKLTQVPWDQVLDVVLHSSQLTYVIDNGVIRVLTKDAMYKELEDDAKQKKATEQAPDLVASQMRLNYASAISLKKLLEQANLVSARGTVEADERSNMLIIKDTPASVDEIRKLVGELDKPEAQVEIEARIVQTNQDTAKELGVQWGLNGRVSPELGNTTNLAFPNNGSLSGRVAGQGAVTQGPNDPRGDASQSTRTGTAVNLPAVAATSALGLSMGAINGAFNLDVQLSALEKKGKVQIVSRPKVVTQNNKPAEVAQGFQIPIQSVANNTVTVQFKDAALKLTVTPQITGANTVIMQIALENGQPDFSRSVAGNPSINTQRANTQVQVADGVTTVIGGILQTTDTTLREKTPGMGSIPLLGWLFRHSSDTSQKQELLIFITPRIIR